MKRRLETQATFLIFALLLAPVGLGVHWLLVLGVGAAWPAPSRVGSPGHSFTVICLRDDAGGSRLLSADSEEGEVTRRRAINGTISNFAMATVWVSDEKRYDWPFLDVPTRRRVALSLAVTHTDIPNTALLGHEWEGMLGLARHYFGESLPTPMRRPGGAGVVAATVILWDGVWHVAARTGAWLLCISGVLFGAAWLTRRVRRGRALLGGACAECGYQITGVRGDRCPECGTRWWEYGEDLGGAAAEGRVP